MRHPSLGNTTAPMLTLLCAAALTACGGGGDSTSSSPMTGGETATIYAANATMVASDATVALDAGVQTAQAVVSVQATAAATTSAKPPMATAQSATATGLTNAAVNCPGGGTAMLTITGGTAESVLNGRLDTGEVYTLVYANCKGAAGAVALNGTLAMTVLSATATDLSLALVATNLSAALPRGTLTLEGSTAHSVSSTTGGNGTTQVTSHFSSPGLTLSTQFNARSSSFTLSAADITRQSTWLNGVLQSSSINGTHTLSATLPNASFTFTVSTQGGVTYATDGTPATGAWTITLPNTLVGVSIANAFATITVDDGKDGTIDRTFTVPIGTVRSAAG